MTAPFDDFVEVFKNMAPDHKQKLIAAHKEFGRLRGFCSAKGHIEILPKMQGIRVLERTKEVKELKKVVDFLKPGGFKWIDETKTIVPKSAKRSGT